jgi:hypothetical protein
MPQPLPPGVDVYARTHPVYLAGAGLGSAGTPIDP